MIDVIVSNPTIDIGRQGENLARNIYFDLSELTEIYGEGTATLVHMRPSDQAPYVCTTSVVRDYLVWSPTSTDTAYAGSGKCELRWVVGDTLAKSIIYTTKIAQSITADESVPAPYKSWYDAIIDYIKANYAASGAPQEVREAIYTLLSKAAYTETGLADELEVVRTWTAENLSITNNLSHVATNNSATIAGYGTSYTATLTANSGYTLGTVTVTMGGEDITATAYSSGTITIPSVTGDIVITATAVAAVASLSAVYTQSGTVFEDTALNSLKDNLVVTVTYRDSTTATISSSDYTLSGTLTAGPSTVTVSYGGATTTFNVTVIQTYNIASTPYTMTASSGQASWDASTQTGTFRGAGTSSYPGLALNGLTYKYSEVSDKTARLRCTITMSGYSGTVSGRGIIFAYGVYTSANPANNGAARKAGYSVVADDYLENGTFEIDITTPVSEMFTATGIDDYYFGFGAMLNAVSGISASVSNLVIEVY